VAAERPFVKRAVEKGADLSQKVDKISLVAGAGFYIIGFAGVAAILIGGAIITYPIGGAVKKWARK
jgi:hypothetical protein